MSMYDPDSVKPLDERLKAQEDEAARKVASLARAKDFIANNPGFVDALEFLYPQARIR